jgi:aryl-alcohol dehydrogenase-like predicted oxidoreductase
LPPRPRLPTGPGEGSLTDHIDIYQPGRLDPNVPVEETVGAIERAVPAGAAAGSRYAAAAMETLDSERPTGR